MKSWQTAVDVVKSCLNAGVGEFVVCAGARNAALLEALARAETAGLIRVWRHFEERSAGFFALGRTMETAQPCAVVTTSGTAVAELLPAIIEAFHQARPLVAITADRPAAFRGTGAPQTIVQPGIFGNHAWQDGFASWDGRQPLHMNVELGEEFEPGEDSFADEALFAFSPTKEKLDVAALARWLREGHFRGMVVMIGGLEPDEREEVFHFCQDLDVPVVAEATSGLREALEPLAIHHAERVLQALPPGKILRLGEVPSSRFWRDLENLPGVSVWSVCRNGLPGLARESTVTRGEIQRVIQALGPIEPAGDALDYLTGASSRAVRADELLEVFPDSEPALLRVVSHYASIGGGVFLGNSLPIREWNQFAQWTRPVTSVRANRGVNGIDGQLSTWLGWSADLNDSWAVVGDLTALYDIAAPFVLEQLACKRRVLAIINNGGGQIFSRLPQLATMSARAAEWMRNSQSADFAGLATLWGMDHLRIRTSDDFDQLDPGDQPLLLEIIPDPTQTDAFWKAWGEKPSAGN